MTCAAAISYFKMVLRSSEDKTLVANTEVEIKVVQPTQSKRRANEREVRIKNKPSDIKLTLQIYIIMIVFQ